VSDNLPRGEQPPEKEPEILRNEVGKVPDPTVVVDEADRTVMLTADETIIIEKEPHIDLPPRNRPRKVYKGMWGPVEVGVAGAGMLAVVGAVLLYVFFVSPSTRELENNRARRDRLETEMASAREKYGSISNVETQVAKLISSVSDFEAQFLPTSTTGRTALYQRINGLMAAYSLIPSSGPDFSPLDVLDGNAQEENKQQGSRSKFRSFFPGVYVTMTVEGPYANLRRFIREIETGSEFIVVSAVELEPSSGQEERESQADPGQQAGMMDSGVDLTTARPNGMPNGGMPQAAQANLPSRSRGKTHGSIVTLRMEMAAYFRRPASADPGTEAQPQ
jgi:hypothetical protein